MVSRGGEQRPEAFAGLRAELAVVLVFGAIAALLIVGLDLRRWVELALLAAIGFAAGGWMAVRTRAAERRALGGREPREGGGGPEQE
ncbi:MAG: hypothetical protein U5L11_09830 [Arhodomonas sp.]|nr:hypothetical protein [Arhodomonas sp.]